MGIAYISEEKLFKLDTPNTTYCIGIIDNEGFLGQADLAQTAVRPA